MKKIVLLFALVFSLVSVSPAQKKEMYRTVEKVGDASLLCHYNFLHREHGLEELTTAVLQIGDSVQKFVSLKNYHEDSLALLVFKNKPQTLHFVLQKLREMSSIPGTDFSFDWELLLNYPKGMRTITDRVFGTHFITEEKDELPSWENLGDTKRISGYECRKAKTKLYGRTWTVWYAPELARADGPWLLRGLPGLVVEARDDSGTFKFELQKIEERSTPIVFRKRKNSYFKADRDHVLKERHRYYENREQYIKSTPQGATLKGPAPDTPKRIFIPLRKIGK